MLMLGGGFISQNTENVPDNFSALQPSNLPGRVFLQSAGCHKPSLALFTSRNFEAIPMIYEEDLLLATFC